jgi:hypothetical protein
MNVYAFDDVGRCIASAEFQSYEDAENYALQNNFAQYKLITEYKKIDAIYYDSGENIVDIPPKPHDYSVFDYDIKQWVDPRTPETQWPIVRAERNRRLQACDWTQLSDIPAETKTLWEPYRQALRDITDQPDPFNIVWPTPPQ